jgi:hypothetical protein
MLGYIIFKLMLKPGEINIIDPCSTEMKINVKQENQVHHQINAKK